MFEDCKRKAGKMGLLGLFIIISITTAFFDPVDTGFDYKEGPDIMKYPNSHFFLYTQPSVNL